MARETKVKKWEVKKARMEKAFCSCKTCTNTCSACALSTRDVDRVQNYLVEVVDRLLKLEGKTQV